MAKAKRKVNYFVFSFFPFFYTGAFFLWGSEEEDGGEKGFGFTQPGERLFRSKKQFSASPLRRGIKVSPPASLPLFQPQYIPTNCCQRHLLAPVVNVRYTAKESQGMPHLPNWPALSCKGKRK